MVALRKPTGGTRGLVVGDFFPCLLPSLAVACRPHQDALCNRAGLDALVHNEQARCARDQALTVVSCRVPRGFCCLSYPTRAPPFARGSRPTALLPFARLWLGRPSPFAGQRGPVSRNISQTEGVEQGEPLSPALFCLALGLRPALRALQQEIREESGGTHPCLPHRCHHPRVASATTAPGSALRVTPCALHTAASQCRRNGPLE